MPDHGQVHEPRCSICTHPEREAIDRALADGVPNLRISAMHDLSEVSIRTHRDRHLAPALQRAPEVRALLSAERIVAELQGVLTRTDDIIESARNVGDDKLALDGLNSLRQSIKLVAELAGKLQPEGTTVVNIADSPDWLVVRSVVLTALADHPEARAAVAGALADMGGTSAPAQIEAT